MASNYPTEVVSQSGDELVIRVFIRPVATVVPNRTRTDPAVSTEGVHPFGPGDVSVSSQDVRVRLARGETLTPSRRQVYGQKGRGPRRTTQALMGEELGPAGMGPPEAPPVFPNGWVPRPREEITPDRPVYYGTECCTRWPRENEVAINCVCGHRIHEGCLTSLLRAYRHDGCPVCVDATTYQQRMELVLLLRGRDGRDGHDGAPGLAGADGADGAPGLAGADGSDGAPGPAGADGADGATGEQGVPGIPGMSGSPGVTGSVYTRWGRTTCGNATKIYHGFAANTAFNQEGGGVNYQCLPLNPQLDSFGVPGDRYATISGVEYQVTNDGSLFNGRHDQNVPCAQCYTTASAVLMVPARKDCPPGSNLEYEGALMTAHANHIQSTTFECVDSHPEVIIGQAANTQGALFQFVKPICGNSWHTTGHCPPYRSDRKLLCAVCSK